MNTGVAASGKLAAIVVSADSGAPLRDSIGSLLSCDALGEVLLFDNASTDGMPQAMAVDHGGNPRLRVIESRRNLGFGAAVNRAAAETAADWLLIVNPDCIVTPAALKLLEVLARTRPDAGLIGVVIRRADGDLEPASQRRDPTMRRVFAGLIGKPEDAVNVVPPAASAGLADVEAISGAMMLMPRDLFARLHGFDEGYFLHFEDLDLCRRVRDAGRAVLLAGRVHATHIGGSSSRHRQVFVEWYKHRGMLRWWRKFDPEWDKLWLRPLAWSGVWLHFMLGLPLWAWRSWRRHGARKRP